MRVGDWVKLAPSIAALAHDPAESDEENARRAERRGYVEGLIAAYMHHVPGMARRFRCALGYDMESHAAHILYISAYTYDPARGIAFYSWWVYRMRALHWYLVHRKAKAMMDHPGGTAMLYKVTINDRHAQSMGNHRESKGQQRVDMMELVEMLDWQDYEAIIANYYMDEGTTETGARTGVTKQVADQRRSQAVRRLRNLVETGKASPVKRRPNKRPRLDSE